MTPLHVALGEIGHKEVAGEGNSADVVKYSQEQPAFSYIKSDSVPWCAIFINWCLNKVGIKGTAKANARSFLSWGVPVQKPIVGDVVVFWRGKKSGWQGHVGFFVNQIGDNIYVLGGNQSDSVSIAPYSKKQLLGYRRAPQTKALGIAYLIKGLEILKKYD